MILASQSPRRIELMQEAGYAPRVIPAAIDETPLPGEQPADLVARLSSSKAHAVAAAHAAPDEIVVAADTVVVLDGEALGKPADADEARSMLARLSGRTHQVMTGVCLLVGGEGSPEPVSFVETTDVTFYALSQQEIDTYVAGGEPMDKAGAYGIQGTGGRLLVRGIAGDFYNVVGLPIAAVVRAIRGLS